jgi:hypothetical protein
VYSGPAIAAQQPGAYGLNSMIAGRAAIPPSPPTVACSSTPSDAVNVTSWVTIAASAGATAVSATATARRSERRTEPMPLERRARTELALGEQQCSPRVASRRAATT